MSQNYLTKEQLDKFNAEGYLLLKNMLSQNLLKKLRLLIDTLINDTEESEKVTIETNGEKYVTNLENICPKGNLGSLELLGSPFILQIAETICGKDFFLIQEFAVIKTLGDQLPVLWHQDMLHNSGGKCFTMGIYLDDVAQNDGALRIVPKSHLSNKSICELKNEPFIEIAANAGDILLHDMMLAHSSEPLQINKLRRVIYFEFVSASHMLKEQIYTQELINRRTRLISAASNHYSYCNEKHQLNFDNNNFTKDYGLDITTVLKEIYSLPINARPSNYCFDHLQ